MILMIFKRKLLQGIFTTEVIHQQQNKFNMCLILVACIILVYLWPLLRDAYLQRPPAPFYVPLVGNMYPYLFNKIPRHKVFMKLSEIYGATFTFRLGRRKVVILNDIAVVTEAYKKGTVFAGRKPNFSLDLTSEEYHEAFATVHSQHWKLLRKFGHTALVRHGVRNEKFEKILTNETEQLLNRLENYTNQIIDPTKDLMLTVINVTAMVVFGQRFTFGDGKFECIEDILNSTFNKTSDKKATRWRELLTSLTVKKNEFKKKHCSEVLLEKLIEEHKTKCIDNPKQTMDVADAVLQSIEENSKKFNIKDEKTKHLLAYVIIFEIFVSSLEPVLATIRWFLVYISRWREIQGNIQQELDRNLNGEKTNLRHQLSLNYLRSTINETARYSSVVPLYPRLCVEDTTLGNYHIPSNTEILINLYALHFDEKQWEQPKRFNPSRWLDNNGKFKKSTSSSFSPFGGGLRRCFGEEMAQLELFHILGNLLDKFTFTEVSSNKHDFEAKEGTFNVTSDFKVLIKKRKIKE